MADAIDEATETIEEHKAREIQKIRAKADIPKGVQGNCDWCGEYTIRLIGGACARCRDRRGLA